MSVVFLVSLGAAAQNNRLTNSADATIAAALPFGTLTPGVSATPASTQVQFRLRSKNATGYRVDGQASFAATLLAAAAGGTTTSASDIGVGITAIGFASGVSVPRNDVISSGFNYDPSTVAAVNGLTPY